MNQQEVSDRAKSTESSQLTERQETGLSVQAAVEQRLAKAESPQDIVLWTGVRQEILRQNEDREDRRHRRQMRAIQLKYKMGFSVAAFLAGIVLISVGFPYPGLFISGAGLYGIAPDYVMRLFKKGKNDENGDN